jgi:branched-chain amino acid transport system substrate-binding protein
MKADLRRLSVVAVAAIVSATPLAGCGGGDEAFRIGVLTDCVGIFRTLGDAQLSGAELPLVERGAELVGAGPAEGLTSVEVAGRRVELVRACTETMEFSTMFEQVRRLAELESVDAIVVGSLGLDAIGLRQIAARYPDVTFVAVPNGPREATLRERPPNLFRVAADHGQVVAGLGTYAYRDLGWRRAAVVALDWDAGWGATAAFVAEFCALGGRVDAQERTVFAPAVRVPKDVDGVALLTGPLAGDQGALIRRLSRRFRPDQLVLGPFVVSDVGALSAAGGSVGASHYPPEGTAAIDAFTQSFRATFPGLQAELARSDFVIPVRNAVEVLLQAVETGGGEAADDARRLQEELRHIETTLLGDPVRIDENGQAIVSSHLVRVGRAPPGQTALVPVRTIDGVDQSIGGLLDADDEPGTVDEPCRKAPLPPWAR